MGAHYRRIKGEYQDQTALGSYANIFAGQLDEWARELDATPEQVRKALSEADITCLTEIPDEDPKLYHFSLVRSEAERLRNYITDE